MVLYNAGMVINDKVYGSQTIDDPLVLELLHAPAMQRLKKLHQYGVYHMNVPEWNTTRYEHSIGVYILLSKFGASREEAVAGLLHDVAHMAFSHVADYVFDRNLEQDVGDNLTKDYIQDQTRIPEILNGHGMSVEKILDKDAYPLLESDAPDMCADRIDYGLRDGRTFGLTTLSDTTRYLNHLQVHNNRWVFDDAAVAREYAEDIAIMSESYWNAPWGVFMYHMMRVAIHRAFNTSVLTKEDMWGADEETWEKMMSGGDETIRSLLHRVKTITPEEVAAAVGSGGISYQRKPRLQDPLVQANNTCVRLSEIYPDLRVKFDELRLSHDTPILYPNWLMRQEH